MRKSERQKKIDALLRLNSPNWKSNIMKCTLYKKDADINMKLRVAPNSYMEVKSLADTYFIGKTKEAFIQAYYLYELLVQDFELGDLIIDQQIRESLDVDTKTLKKIRSYLGYYGILYVDTSEYNKSLKNYLKKNKGNNRQKIKRYKYEAGAFISNGASDLQGKIFAKKQSITIEFKVTEYIYELIKFFKDIEKVSRFKQADQETRVLNILLGFLKRNKQIFKKKNEDFLQKSKNSYSKSIYIAPYEDLQLDYSFAAKIMQVRKWDTLLLWIINHDQSAKVTSNTRLWHPFHNLAREYRKYITYDGSRLIEAMDVHNCFYVLMLKAFELNESVDINELQRYSEVVREGKLYELFVEEKIKDIPSYCIDYSETRKKVKTELQSYRNMIYEGEIRHVHQEIDDVFKRNFPTIRQALLDYPLHINSEGKTVKRLQKDMCIIETYLISQVCFRLKEEGVTPFSLHDGIYLSEADMQIIREAKGLDSIEDVQGWIEGLFWKYFDELTAEKTKHLIESDWL